MIVPILLFVCGLVLLIKGGDWFVDGATAVARRFGLPEILIGATVVSIGTTLPEVMVSATAAFKGSGQIAYGNAIGSIICNTALIAALTVAVKPSKIDKNSLKMPVLFFFISAAFYCAIAYLAGGFSRFTGIVLLAVFVVYIIYSSLAAKEHISKNKQESTKAEEPKTPFLKDLLLLVLGAALIAVGAKLLVDNGIKIAEWLKVPESVIGLTFVALGTSLPELVTAVTALIKGHSELSLGNIVGANLFNLVLVSGVSVVISPFAVPSANTFLGYNTSLLVEIPIMLFVMAFLTLPAIWRGKLYRAQGILLLVIYLAFCVFQFAV